MRASLACIIAALCAATANPVPGAKVSPSLQPMVMGASLESFSEHQSPYWSVLLREWTKKLTFRRRLKTLAPLVPLSTAARQSPILRTRMFWISFKRPALTRVWPMPRAKLVWLVRFCSNNMNSRYESDADGCRHSYYHCPYQRGEWQHLPGCCDRLLWGCWTGELKLYDPVSVAVGLTGNPWQIGLVNVNLGCAVIPVNVWTLHHSVQRLSIGTVPNYWRDLVIPFYYIVQCNEPGLIVLLHCKDWTVCGILLQYRVCSFACAVVCLPYESSLPTTVKNRKD